MFLTIIFIITTISLINLKYNCNAFKYKYYLKILLLMILLSGCSIKTIQESNVEINIENDVKISELSIPINYFKDDLIYDVLNADVIYLLNFEYDLLKNELVSNETLIDCIIIENKSNNFIENINITFNSYNDYLYIKQPNSFNSNVSKNVYDYNNLYKKTIDSFNNGLTELNYLAEPEIKKYQKFHNTQTLDLNQYTTMYEIVENSYKNMIKSPNFQFVTDNFSSSIEFTQSFNLKPKQILIVPLNCVNGFLDQQLIPLTIEYSYLSGEKYNCEIKYDNFNYLSLIN